jgi:preprotein translocase subunit SecA
MLKFIVQKFLGSRNQRFLNSLNPLVLKINSLEKEYEGLTNDQLKEKTSEFRDLIKEGSKLDDILPFAFALVREASKRVLGQRHYDVQLIGGIILHKGKISEMKTGEGKTLVSTLAAYLNAIEGKGVHIVTVNDYLARRDAAWMSKIFNFLGLSVGCVTGDLEPNERKLAYACDITYATNNELGFDYLRDNMRFSKEEMVQRPFNFAIIDEVDSILIDEARTPLIISGSVNDDITIYQKLNKFIGYIKKEHFDLDEKDKNVSFTEKGLEFLEEKLKQEGFIKPESSLFDLENISIVHGLNQALKAHKIFKKDVDYIVQNARVIIIDEFTGRMMEGRRFSDGLHQAIEAKEGVRIKQENQTLASITFQNYFRLYPKLSGMTGTAITEANEFFDIYGLDVIVVPTNKPVARIDENDDIFRTKDEKYKAIIKLIKDCGVKKQPVLAGTASIEQSEYLSKLLTKEKIKHQVLNARFHVEEASIIAQAGKPNAVTIATNMAGRGTDIQLGGNLELILKDALKDVTDQNQKDKITNQLSSNYEEDKKTVLLAGGLCVIGTERHESRRIDNQLRGRSGRQGDPGFSKFFLSTEDDLLRLFGTASKMNWVMGALGKPDEPINHPLITKLMEQAQKKVEARNYEIRKNLLKFDDVMNDQRKIVYDQRINIMNSQDVKQNISEFIEDVIEDIAFNNIPENEYFEKWNLEAVEKEIFTSFNFRYGVREINEDTSRDVIVSSLKSAANTFWQQKENQYSEKVLRDLEKKIFLYTIDEQWQDHLLTLDDIRQGINLRAYGQKDPLNEYKKEAFNAFSKMLEDVKKLTVSRIFHATIHSGQEEKLPITKPKNLTAIHQSFSALEDEQRPQENKNVVLRKASENIDPNNPATWGRVGRNDNCPCGSGKKFKHCHGSF